MQIDPKRAIPRQDNVKTAKCFIGGIPSTATSDSFKAFFQQYGNVLDSTLMMDRETQKPRGYGFVTYDNDSTVEKLLSIDGLTMDGKLVSTCTIPVSPSLVISHYPHAPPDRSQESVATQCRRDQKGHEQPN